MKKTNRFGVALRSGEAIRLTPGGRIYRVTRTSLCAAYIEPWNRGKRRVRVPVRVKDEHGRLRTVLDPETGEPVTREFEAKVPSHEPPVSLYAQVERVAAAVADREEVEQDQQLEGVI